MKQLLTKTYLYFWAIAALTVLIGYELFVTINNTSLEINVHDTYFVISNFDFTILIAYALAFIGLIYYLHAVFSIPLIKFLTTIHTLITIGCVILYFLSPMFQFGSYKDFPLFDDEPSIDFFLIIVGGIVLLAQPILIFNSIFNSIRCFIQGNKKL